MVENPELDSNSPVVAPRLALAEEFVQHACTDALVAPMLYLDQIDVACRVGQLDVESAVLPRSGEDDTEAYLHAHLAVREAVLAKVAPMAVERPNRFKADDQLLAFLDVL